MNRMSNLKFETLVKALCVTTSIGLSGLFITRAHLRSKFQSEGYYKKTKKIVEENETVGKLLGRPIKFGKLDIGDATKFYVTKGKAFVTIATRGPYDVGSVTSYCVQSTRPEEAANDGNLSDGLNDEIPKDRWEVMRVELRVSKHKDKRLIVFRRPEADEEFVNTFHDFIHEGGD